MTVILVNDVLWMGRQVVWINWEHSAGRRHSVVLQVFGEAGPVLFPISLKLLVVVAPGLLKEGTQSRMAADPTRHLSGNFARNSFSSLTSGHFWLASCNDCDRLWIVLSLAQFKQSNIAILPFQVCFTDTDHFSVPMCFDAPAVCTPCVSYKI